MSTLVAKRKKATRGCIVEGPGRVTFVSRSLAGKSVLNSGVCVTSRLRGGSLWPSGVQNSLMFWTNVSVLSVLGICSMMSAFASTAMSSSQRALCVFLVISSETLYVLVVLRVLFDALREQV